MTEKELKKIILSALREVAPDADIENLDPNIEFRDQFDFDSVDFLNFTAALEKAFKIHIPESDCPKLGTVNGGIGYLKDAITQTGEGRA